MVTQVVYAAIRRNESTGEESIDLETVAHNRSQADNAAVRRTPWAKVNPVVRIAKMTLTEMPADETAE